MVRELYDDTHVAICRLLDRRHNNPLEDAPWPLLERLLARERPRVLDVGCGRGASSLAWARRGAQVVGIDPSDAMVAEARRNREIEGDGLDATFLVGRLEDLGLPGRFDLVLLHDVLCYVPDRAAALALALDRVRPGGVLSVTDYHGTPGLPSVEAVTTAWGIRAPVPFPDYETALASTGAHVLMATDTTRRYRTHWAALLDRLEHRRDGIEVQVGRPAVEAFAAQVGAILAAIDGGAFGHLWAVLEAAP